MAIPVGFIDAADCRPELVGSDRWSRECRLLPRIGTIPVRGSDGGRRVRRILEHIIGAGLMPVGDRLDLRANGDHRFTEPV